MFHVSTYCKSGNFRENFIFANSVKNHICDATYSRLGHDFSISVNDRVISPFREDFIFTIIAYAKFRGNKILAKFSEFTIISWCIWASTRQNLYSRFLIE